MATDKYKIQRGDTLSAIAKKNKITLRELLKANPQIKNADQIYAGDYINIPQQYYLGETLPEVTVHLSPKQLKLRDLKIYEKKAEKERKKLELKAQSDKRLKNKLTFTGWILNDFIAPLVKDNDDLSGAILIYNNNGYSGLYNLGVNYINRLLANYETGEETNFTVGKRSTGKFMPELTLETGNYFLNASGTHSLNPASQDYYASPIQAARAEHLDKERREYERVYGPPTLLGTNLYTITNRRLSGNVDGPHVGSNSYNLREFRFTPRNRYEYAAIKSPGLLFHTQGRWEPYSDSSKQASWYFRLNKDSKLEIVPASEVLYGDMVSATDRRKIYKIAYNDDGTLLTAQASGGNSKFNNVKYYKDYGNGVPTLANDGEIGILLNKADKNGTMYTQATGGQAVIQVGEEVRLVTGSVKDINAVFEDMKKRHGQNYGYFYLIDNGTYNRGSFPVDGQFTILDFKTIDAQNSLGGHGLLIKPY